MKVKFKDDYLKIYPRTPVGTTIRRDVYEKFQMLSIRVKQPTSKMFDVALLQIFKDEKSTQEFLEKLKEY